MWAWILTVAGLASMRAAIDRGDIDEAARQGVLAGPRVIEEALAAPDRAAKLAGIAAAPTATDRQQLLDPLAKVAASGDRRVAIPAARAAREIAREFSRAIDLPDDVAAEDVDHWRARWQLLALDRDRFIEVRTLALDTAAALDRIPGHNGIGIDLGVALADSDPAFRAAAIYAVPSPVPAAMRKPLADAVVKDTDPVVALAAAASLCADLAVDPKQPILDALGTAGVDRIKSLTSSAGSKAQQRDAARCLR